MIAQTRSITAQNTYIYKLADLLPDFDYLQIEQIVNNSRLHQRQEAQKVDDQKRRIFSRALAESWDNALDQGGKSFIKSDEGFSNGPQ